MQKIIWERKWKIYRIKKIIDNNSQENMFTLGELFLEVMNEDNFLLDILQGKINRTGITGDVSGIDIIGNNVHICNELFEPEDDPNPIVLPITELAKAVEKWHELKQQDCDEIVLEKHGKKLTLTGIVTQKSPVFIVPLTKKKDKVSYNTESEYPDEPYNQILLFLVYDCQNTPVQRWIDFLNSPKKKYKKGNSANLEKIDDIVHVSYFIPKVYRKDPSMAFTLTKKRLIQLIHEWDFLVKSNPEQINVIFDHGNVRLES